MWADVFADAPARRQIRGSSNRGALYIYRLRDEPRAIILVACTKCGWKGVQRRRNLSPCTVLIAPFRPARSCRSGLLKDRLELGPLRRAFFRAHRRTAMTTHPAPFQGRFYRDPRSPRSHSPDGVYAQPKSKTPPSRKVWPRFEEVVPCAEPRHGRGPEGGVPLNSGVGALGGKGNTRCSRLQRTNHPAVPKQARGMAHRWRCCEERRTPGRHPSYGHSTFTAFCKALCRSLCASVASASESKWNVTQRVVLSVLLTRMTWLPPISASGE